jgi:hypothetical protein
VTQAQLAGQAFGSAFSTHVSHTHLVRLHSVSRARLEVQTAVKPLWTCPQCLCSLLVCTLWVHCKMGVPQRKAHSPQGGPSVPGVSSLIVRHTVLIVNARWGSSRCHPEITRKNTAAALQRIHAKVHHDNVRRVILFQPRGPREQAYVGRCAWGQHILRGGVVKATTCGKQLWPK